jgi:hypothetical protein
MSFDAARVIETASYLDVPRRPGSRGSREAAALVRRAFRRAGLVRVVSEQHLVNPRSMTISWLVLLILLVASNRALAGLSWVVSLAVPLTLIVLLDWDFRPLGRGRIRTTILAARPSRSKPFARIIVATQLEADRNVWVWNVPFGLIIGFGPLLGPVLLHRLGWWLACQCYLCAGLALSIVARYATRSFQGDNRSGLGMLVELARTWPAALGDGIDVIFAALPRPAMVPYDIPSRVADGLPRLFVTLDVPGIGPQIQIAGRGSAGAIAAQSAEDLWLPYRVARRLSASEAVPFDSRAFPDCVVLAGKRSDSPIDPEMLSATAQLVTEIAMRWAKQVRQTKEKPLIASDLLG